MNGDMTSDQQLLTAERQLCPYCGRLFKRLKTHLPHCKLAPIAKELDSCQTSASSHSGVLPKCTSSMGQTVTTAPERPPDSNLLKNTGLSPKVSPKKSRKSSVSNGGPRVMTSKLGKGGIEAVSPAQRNLPGDNRNLLRSAHRGNEALGEAASDPRGRQTKVKLKEKDMKNKAKQTVAQESPPSSSRQSVVEAERKSGASQTEPPARTPASGILGSEGPSGSLFCVGGDAEDTRGAFKVKPAVLGLKPLDSSALATETVLLHKLRPLSAVDNMCKVPTPMVSSLPACTHTSPLNPSKAPAGPRPAGLEWMPELALAYRGISFSMLPRRPCRTEHVQKHSPQIQPIAAEIQGCLAERAFVDVRLAELPSWLMSRPLPSPRAGVASLQRGWRWYYSRYIDVRRGGVGGVAMLLTTYCVLSYVWSYPRLKEERWRKYH
ncbi:uncharacterized protein [Paramormyrops kingsleyae]|uniref:uncharacterized protein n=1 Tax=Paramormyrops kingsleyae TaxID=1676925 RepID=UPI003B971ACF